MQNFKLRNRRIFPQSFNRNIPVLKQLPGFALLMTLLVMMALTPLGCSTTESASYPTLKETQTNVSLPMTRYRNAAAFGGITTSEKQQVNTAYQAYQTAFNQALQDAHGNYDAPAPENVKARANELIRVLAAVQS